MESSQANLHPISFPRGGTAQLVLGVRGADRTRRRQFAAPDATSNNPEVPSTVETRSGFRHLLLIAPLGLGDLGRCNVI